MALYMIEWKSLDPRVTTSLFSAGVLSFAGGAGAPPRAGEDPAAIKKQYPIVIPQDIKLQSSVHVVGQPQGFILVQSPPEQIHQMVLAIPPGLVELTIHNVIEDPAARAAMSTRSSEYKLR